MKRTTTRGVCRTCGHRWKVPRTSLEPGNLRKVPGLTYVKGLDAVCPRCKSTKISWLLDNPRSAPTKPTRA